MKTKFLILMVIGVCFSCTVNNEVPIDPNNLLLGNWSNAVYTDSLTTYERVNQLPDEAYGIAFKQEGVFVTRSSGFCGTPPLTFFDIFGTFQLEEGLILIKNDEYPNTYNLRIVSLTEEKLVVTRELTQQEKEHRELMKLFNELSVLSLSKTCTDGSDWSFTAYGSKACGGPQGYIAYSNQIDTADFLQKVAIYTEAENQFNIKWGVVSTCDIPAEPKSVECQNGYPILKY